MPTAIEGAAHESEITRSEPHLPFGGLRQSGHGAREAGAEALDVYSDGKTSM